MADVQECTGCSGSVQHESYLNATYDVPWTAWIHDDQVCVHFDNSITQTNVNVRTWVEDSDGNGDLTTPLDVAIAAGAQAFVCFSNFGFKSDQVTPRDQVKLHAVLSNTDSPGTGVEIWHRIH